MSRNGSQGRSDHGDETAKIFITNLSPTVPEEELRKDLEPRFEKYGRIKHLNVKKNKNGLYSFAFLEFYSA
jgi:RNA recognition motif-containing protein